MRFLIGSLSFLQTTIVEAGDLFSNLLQTDTAKLLNLFEEESLTDMFQGISGKGGMAAVRANRAKIVKGLATYQFGLVPQLFQQPLFDLFLGIKRSCGKS